jgi:predicted DNA-binding transcriptional regulator AlpA
VTRSVAPLADVPGRLRALADRAEAEALGPGDLVGQLEALKFEVWTRAMQPEAPAPAGPSRGLDVAAVEERTGMSKDWLYREARAGRLPFARRLGRRVVFDQAGLTRWLERRRSG